MHDDNDQISHDDEYQFPEEEFIQGESTGRSSIEVDDGIEAKAMDARRAKIMKVFNRIQEILANRIVAAVLAVIILLFVFHFFFTSSHKKAQPAAQPQQPVAQQVVQTSQPNTQMLNQLTGIKQSASTMHDSVAQLKTQMATLQASLSQLNQSHQDSQNALINLAKKMNAMQANETKLMASLVHKKAKHRKHVIVIPPVHFYTRAVIHNRAWVVGTNGDNVSVTVGSHLQDYGKILSINVNTGVIKTSSKRIITYAPGDR